MTEKCTQIAKWMSHLPEKRFRKSRENSLFWTPLEPDIVSQKDQKADLGSRILIVDKKHL